MGYVKGMIVNSITIYWLIFAIVFPLAHGKNHIPAYHDTDDSSELPHLLVWLVVAFNVSKCSCVALLSMLKGHSGNIDHIS